MSNIRVALRIRPLSERETDDGSQEIVNVSDNSIRIENVKMVGLQEFGDTRSRIREFLFDHCYDSMHGDTLLSSQAKVFEDLGTEVLKAAFDGFNACVFAYGQTGTGKTHTMMGQPDDVGLIPRICESLFTHMSQCTDEHVTCRMDISYFEIYNERVRDLLQPELLKLNENYSLKIREHPKEGPYVKDLSWHRVKNIDEIQTLLNKGNDYRVTAETYMHGHSSRSHAIVTVCFTQARLEENRPSEIVSKINLVDLAGSERADPSSRPDFRKRLTEGANINKSLVTLGYVIKALAERSLLSWSTEEMGSIQNFQSSAGGETQAGSSPAGPNKQRVPYIPYRDSVLTWLLKDSLGGNSKTIMIATITPASQYYSESISTLRYAQRAKNIINKPRINQDGNVALIRELKQEIERLHGMLASAAQMGSNLVTFDDVEDAIIEEKLHVNEEMAKQLTQSWMCKWSSTHDIMQESDLSIRGLRNRSSSMGVMIDSQLPYLIGMDDDILSTGIVIFHLKEGDTLVGGEDADTAQDIVLHGPTIQKDHCIIQHMNGDVFLRPCLGALCAVQGIECVEPTKLSQGDYVILGGNQVFRFNNPSEAAKLRENRRSQGSLNTLSTSHLSFGGLSRASSYSSIGGDDSNFLSPHSQFGRNYPNYAAPDLCQDLERRYQTEQERIDEASKELERLKNEYERSEELRQLKEEEMYQSHEQHRADIEEQKRHLARLIEENERARDKSEVELQLARESLAKEKEAFKKQLDCDRRRLQELEKVEQQQESTAIQTDPLSTHTASVGSESTTTISTGTDDDFPVRFKGGRRLSVGDQLDELQQSEFSRRMSYRETEECLAIQQEDIEDAYLQTQGQIEDRIRKIQEIEEEYKEMDKVHLQEIDAQSEKVHEIRKQEVQLEVYIQENEELMNVCTERPCPLRSACSEMFLMDPSIQNLEYSQKATSLHDIQGDVRGNQQQLSSKSKPLRRSTSSESLEGGVSEDPNVEEEQKKLQKDRNICSVAKQVTSRLYKAPEPKFKYVPKVKEKDIAPIPRSKSLSDRNSELKSRSKPVNALRDFDRSKSESPHRVTGKRNSPSPARAVDLKKISASAPHRDPTIKDGSKPKDSKTSGDKHAKGDSKVMAVRNKGQGPHRNVSETSGLCGNISPTTRLGGAGSPATRLGGVVSPEKLAPSPVRTSTPGVRQMSSASSLASVPESLTEHEDINVNENHKEQDKVNYVVKKRQKKGRASFLDDNFRCHSAPDSHVMSSALDEYTDQMNTELQHGFSNSDQVVPVLTASVSVDGSVLYQKEEIVSDTDDGAKLGTENEFVGIDSEIQMNANTENIDQVHMDSEIELSALGKKTVHMYISSGDESKSIDGLDVFQGDEVTVDLENTEDSIKSIEHWTSEVSESLTDNPMESTCESNVAEDTEVIVLRKRERTNSDKINDIDVPNKKSKPIVDHENETENITGINSGENKPVLQQKSVIEINDNENFSEDSLDMSIDSLDDEKHTTRLTQSLPAYLIRPEKPMSDDSLSDSFDEQNKDAKDSLETDQTDINEVGTISAVEGVLGTVEMEISNQSSVSNVESVNSDIGCNDNTAMGSLPVSKKPKLGLVSLEPINFIPPEGLRNIQDEIAKPVAQCEITCLIDNSDENSLTPVNEDLSDPASDVVETSSNENSEFCITPFDSPEYSDLEIVTAPNVGTLGANTEHSDMNQNRNENETDNEKCAIKESVTKSKQFDSEFEYMDIKGDSSGEHQDHTQLVVTCRNNDVDYVPSADMNEVRSYVNDILNRAQETYIESFEHEDARSIEEELPGIQEQINNSASKFDVYSTKELEYSIEKEPAHSFKQVINTTEELGMDNLNHSDSHMCVRAHDNLDTNLVAVNIQNERIHNYDSIDSSVLHQSEKDNTNNRTTNLKHVDKTVLGHGNVLEVEILCDQNVAAGISNEVSQMMDHITPEIGELVAAAANLHSEIDEMETGPTAALRSENNTYFMERKESDYSSDGQIGDNSVDEKSQKHASVVDENHNVIAMATQEENEAGNDDESVEADLTDGPKNKTDEAIPTFQTSDNIDSHSNDIDTENDFSKVTEYKSESSPIIKGRSKENVAKTTFETDNACELTENTELVDTQQAPNIILACHTIDIQHTPEVTPEHMEHVVDTQQTPDIIPADNTVDAPPAPKITLKGKTLGTHEITLEDDTVGMPHMPEVTPQDKTGDTQPTSKLIVEDNTLDTLQTPGVTPEYTVDTPQAHDVTPEDNTLDTQETPNVIPADDTVDSQKTHEVTAEDNNLDTPQTPEVIPEYNTVASPQAHKVTSADNTLDTQEAPEVIPEDDTVDTQKTLDVTVEDNNLDTSQIPEVIPEDHTVDTPLAHEVTQEDNTDDTQKTPELTVEDNTVYTPLTLKVTPSDSSINIPRTPDITLEHMALTAGTKVTPHGTSEVTELYQHIPVTPERTPEVKLAQQILVTPEVTEFTEDTPIPPEQTPNVITISTSITAEVIPENDELTEYTPISPGLAPEDTGVAEGTPILHEFTPKITTIAMSLEHEVTHQDSQMLRDSASSSIVDKSSINKDATQHADTADITTASSSLVLTRTVGVGTSQELLDHLDDVMGDNCSQGSNDSFLLDPRQELQVLQEALEKLPAKPTTGSQLSTARRAARQRAMIRQQHRGADSDGLAQLSDESPLSGTQTQIFSRPGSGSRRRKRPTTKAAERATKQFNENSSDDYNSSENDSVYSNDSVDAIRPTNGQNGDVYDECAFSDSINDDIVFYDRIATTDMLSRPKHKRHGRLSPGHVHPRPDFTEIVDEPHGRRTVGIQTMDTSSRNRSLSSARTDLSDFDVSFASDGRGMVMSPLSLWNSNERSGSGSQSDRNSTSSAGFVKNLNDIERSMTPTPRSSTRSNASLFSDRSNLEKGPTEVWSSSSSELHSLQSFRDDLSYVIETEGMSPGASSLDYTEDARSQHSSIYMRTPKEGERHIPRPECSTPTNSGRVVNISFPESQLQQAANIDASTPVKFEVTVHEESTNIEYNVEKTEYKTYSLRNQNEPNIIPDRILVNLTENINTRIEENHSTHYREEITIHQPDIVRSPEDSLVLERSYKSSSSSEREIEIENGTVKTDLSKELKNETELKSHYIVPCEGTVKETVVRKREVKLQHSGVVEATSYPSTAQEVEVGLEPVKPAHACAEDMGASLNESENTSDYGTITSIDGRKGFMSFTSDSEDNDSIVAGSPEISRRHSHIAMSKLAGIQDQNGELPTTYLPLQNEITGTYQNSIIITEEGQHICSTTDVDANIAIAGTFEHSAILPQMISQPGSSTEAAVEPPAAENKPADVEHDKESIIDLGYESLKPVSDDNEKVEQFDDDNETDSSSVSTVRQLNVGENQYFCSQETLDDVTNLTGSHENVEAQTVDNILQSDAQIPNLELIQSSINSPRIFSCSSTDDNTDDTYVSFDQSESNTSTSSSDYKTPQQSPRDQVEQENVVSEEVEEVVIPDYYEDENSQFTSTPRQEFDDSSQEQAPMLTSSPKRINDVRTVSVNTESVPSVMQSVPPATSRVKHIFDKSNDPVHTETFRKNLEKKIAKLQHHVRSLSDSAISSDFTDGDSSSLSPRGSRVYDDKSFFVEKRLLHYPIKVFRATQSPARVRQPLDFDGLPSSKLAFKDSGNVFDEDDLHCEEAKDCPQRSIKLKKDGQQVKKPSEKHVLLSVTPVGTFPERLIDALLAIKPHPIQRCASLDSLSTIVNMNPQLSRAVRESQSTEDLACILLPTNETEDGNVSDCARSLSPGEIGLGQDSFNDMHGAIEKEIIIPEDVIPAQTSQNRRISEKSTSMSILGDNLHDREYHRSLSEGNIDDFHDDDDNSNASNDSITFVFIGGNRLKVTSEGELENEQYESANGYDPCGSGELYDSESQSPESRLMSSPGEYPESDLSGELNISGRGHPSNKSEDRVSDVLSRSGSDDSSIEFNQESGDNEEEQLSTHSASEEIEGIIYNNDIREHMHGSRDISVRCQADSPPTYTDTSDGLVQNRGRYFDDDDSEPLRHKFGIDESVLPIPERSVSADNIPKHLTPIKDLMRSRSTGMLAVGIADEPESESGIFPPALKTDDDLTETSVSLHTMSEGGLDHTSLRTFSDDMEASLSNRTSCDVDSENSNSEDNSSAVVRSICSRSSSIEDIHEEFIINYKTIMNRPKIRMSVENSGSSEGENNAQAVDDEEQIRKVLETVQRLIMPKPIMVDRGMATDSESDSNIVSVGVQTRLTETSTQTTEGMQAVLRADQIILPAQAAPFRAQSADSLGLGANGQGLELSEESRNWCTLAELMVETTYLLRRINNRLPDRDRKGSLSSSEESQASQILLQKWQEISVQTGRSMDNLNTIGSQTDGDATVAEAVEINEEIEMRAESTQVEPELRMETLDWSETITQELLPEAAEVIACDISVQTDEDISGGYIDDINKMLTRHDDRTDELTSNDDDDVTDMVISRIITLPSEGGPLKEENSDIKYRYETIVEGPSPKHGAKNDNNEKESTDSDPLQAIVPVSFSVNEKQMDEAAPAEILKSVENGVTNKIPCNTAAKFIPQIKAELGIDQYRDSTSEATPGARSPGRSKTKPAEASKSPSILLPGFTLPDTPEIVELRKEHARLMENLRKASDDRSNRKETLLARKKAQTSEDGSGEGSQENSFNKPAIATNIDKYENVIGNVLRKAKPSPRVNKPNKNDPETESSVSESSAIEDIMISDDNDEESTSGKDDVVDIVRSDGNDEEIAIVEDVVEDIVRADDNDTESTFGKHNVVYVVRSDDNDEEIASVEDVVEDIVSSDDSDKESTSEKDAVSDIVRSDGDDMEIEIVEDVIEDTVRSDGNDGIGDTVRADWNDAASTSESRLSETDIVKSDGENDVPKQDAHSSFGSISSPLGTQEFVQINIQIDPNTGVKVESKIFSEDSPKRQTDKTKDVGKYSSILKKHAHTKEQHTWELAGDELRTVWEIRPESRSRTESNTSQDTTGSSEVAMVMSEDCCTFGPMANVASRAVSANPLYMDDEDMDVIDDILEDTDCRQNVECPINEQYTKLEHAFSQRKPIRIKSIDEEISLVGTENQDSHALVIEKTLRPEHYERDQSLPIFFKGEPDSRKAPTEDVNGKELIYHPDTKKLTSSQKSHTFEEVMGLQNQQRADILPSAFRNDSNETLSESEPESVSINDPRERGPPMPKPLIKSETSPKYKSQILREQQIRAASPELMTPSDTLLGNDAPHEHFTEEKVAIYESLPITKSIDKEPPAVTSEKSKSHHAETKPDIHISVSKSDTKHPDIKRGKPQNKNLDECLPVLKFDKKPSKETRQVQYLDEDLPVDEKDSSNDPAEYTSPPKSDQCIQMPTSSIDKEARPTRFTDDATQISVEFSDDCTQTDLDSPFETISPVSDKQSYSLPNSSKQNDSTGQLQMDESKEPKTKNKDMPITETKTPQEFREELEDLQHERQHIMDLLGLSYLPNSLTVELLEAKLNYCIGQTDLLLDNLEDNAETEDQKKKPTQEQNQTKDYVAKYRADLKKSKQDIEECREHLNKGRGSSRGAGRGQTPLRRRDFLNQQRQAEVDAFKLERMREQQDYGKSGHGTPLKVNTPLKGNTPLRGNTPLHGSPVVTPRSERSRSSSPHYSPGYMNPREHKAHLVDLRKQLITDVVAEEQQHSRSCSPSLHCSPPPVNKHRSLSELSLGFSPNVSVSLSDIPDAVSSPPSSHGSKTYIVAPGSSKLSPLQRPAFNELIQKPSASPCSSYHSSPDRVGLGRRPSSSTLDRKMMAESIFSEQESVEMLLEIEEFKKHTPSMSIPMEELLRRASFSSSSSQRSGSSRPDLPSISPRSHSDLRMPVSHSISPVAGQLDIPLSLNLDCLPDDETGPYSPYSAYAREHIIPNERSPPGGVLRGTYELYHDRSDTSSVVSYESDTFSDSDHRPPLDEDTIKRLRPIRADDIKARINRHKR